MINKKSYTSTKIESWLSLLARKHSSTRFIRLSYEEAEMDPVGVPAVLGYRGGELFANLVGIVDLLPDTDNGDHGDEEEEGDDDGERDGKRRGRNEEEEEERMMMKGLEGVLKAYVSPFFNFIPSLIRP